MATFRTFEDIEAWQMARELAKTIYCYASRGSFARDFGLRDQMQRAAVSVMANIAEGYERNGNKEFLQFLSLAKGSVGELRSHLYVALDQAYITQAEFDDVRTHCTSVSVKIYYLMETLRRATISGPKYKPPTP